MATQRLQIAPLAVGISIGVVAVLVAAGAASFPVDRGYSILGPHVFPYAVAAFLAAIAVLLCREAVTGGLRNMPDDPPPVPSRAHMARAAWISGGLLAIAGLINVLGFVLAAAVLFAMAARGFGSRKPARDVLIGVALTLPVFWLFTMGLGLSLPSLVNAWF